MKLQRFIHKHALTLTVVRKASRDDGLMSDMPNHWLYTITKPSNGWILEGYFSQGSAHDKPPTLEDILGCLASDAAGYVNATSFEDWCGEYGYDTDSRSAERIYKQCGNQASQLRGCFEGDLDTLLFNTERI